MSQRQANAQHSHVPYNLNSHIIYLVSFSKGEGEPGGLEGIRSKANRHLNQIPEEYHPSSAPPPKQDH